MKWLVVVLASCSFEHGTATRDATGPIDAQNIDADIDAEIDAAPSGPWGAPSVVVLPTPTNTDDDASMTDDQLELFINSSRGGNSDVYIATRATTTDAWSTPTAVTAVSSGSIETTPEISYDGLTLILASNRDGTQDLYISTRPTRNAPWDTPELIGGVNSSASEAAGNMTPDGLTFVFSSTKSNGSPDLFISQRADVNAAWETPVELTALNTNGHEGSPCISADAKTLVFDSNRSGTLDVWMSQRTSIADAFPAPVRLDEIATQFSDEDPWLSRDGRRLVFTSNRSGTPQLWEATR